MALMANKSVRCDGCGQLTRAKDHSYVRKNGERGYILGRGFWGMGEDGPEDFCNDCNDANRIPAAPSEPTR